MEDAIGYLVLLAIIAGCIWAMVNNSKKEKTQKERALELVQAKGIKAPVMLRAGGVTLAQHAGSGRTLIAKTEELIFTELTADRLLSVEVKEDGSTIQHASRPRQIGGAVVGGAVAGTAGAVIGGLGSKARERSQVNRVELRLVLSDPSNSTVVMSLLNVPGKGVGRNSGAHKGAEFKANEWLGRLRRIYKQEPSTVSSSSVAAAPSKPADVRSDDANVVDSLTKLVNMLEAGHLTKAEFDSQKAKLLRGSS